ncbi:hypothetical protein K1719_008418 [Acacia pycnantha]|nr:hypothetical protein K1719_008418 [Acacia pycnantha]
MKPQSIEEWRKYFERGNCSIYQIINNAIRVAALDQPEEFKLRRNKILERLYSCQFTGNCCCLDQTTEHDIHTTISQVFRDCKKACPHNETTNKVDDSAVAGGGGRATGQQANEPGNNIIEDARDENIRCVLQIKDQLESNKLTETEIYESLRKLRSLVRSVSVIEATKIGITISNLRQHGSKEISLLATIMTDRWKSMIAELVDNKTAETTAEKSKNPAPRFVLEEWREFPSAEFIPQPPVEFSENFLDDLDDYENAAVTKDNNETKLKTMKDSAEKFKSGRSNEPSNKSNVKVENSSGATTEKNPSMGNKRKMEDEELVIPTIKRQKPAKSAPKPKLLKTEQKPRMKKEVQNHNSEPRTRYRALRMSAEPTHAIIPRARESRRSSGNTARQERLETSKNKLQADYQAHALKGTSS